jgi:hypothetical protein
MLIYQSRWVITQNIRSITQRQRIELAAAILLQPNGQWFQHLALNHLVNSPLLPFGG